MTVKPIAAAAMLCALCATYQPAAAQPRVRIAQNVAYVICAPKPATPGQCLVHEPRDPCPAGSAEAFPKPMYATIGEACREARKLSACRSVSGC